MATQNFTAPGDGTAPLARLTLENAAYAEPFALADCREMTLLSCRFTGEGALPRLVDSLLSECAFAPTAIRALWGGVCLNLQGGEMLAPEALFGAETVTVERMTVNGGGFAAGCREVVLRDARFTGVRLFSRCASLRAENVEVTGDSALASLADASVDFSTLTGNDLLWGARDVTVTDTVIDGDRFGWFTENLTLRGCLLTGRAPLRFTRGLVLDGCKVVDTGEKSGIQS